MKEKDKSWWKWVFAKPLNTATTFGGIAFFGLISGGGGFTEGIGAFIGGGVLGLVIYYIIHFFKK